MHDPDAIARARELSVEVIARPKRILSLVDDYATIQSSTNRAALRRALFDEFHAAAREGWIAERQVTSITYSAQFGQVARNTVTPEMLA